MNKTRVLAASVVLALTVAACGDDDDDAGGDTTPDVLAPAATAPGEAESPAPATGDAPADPATADNPELAADCQTFGSFEPEGGDATLDVGDEITDEHRSVFDNLVDGLNGLDFETDEANAARDAFVDHLAEIRNADVYTAEMEEFPDEFTAFAVACSSADAGG